MPEDDLEARLDLLLARAQHNGLCKFCALPDELYDLITAKFRQGFRGWKAFSMICAEEHHPISRPCISGHFDSKHYAEGRRET